MALTKQKSSPKPLIELGIASLFWGFGFIGVIWAVQSISPSAIVFYRFFGAFIFTTLFIYPFLNKKHISIKKEFELGFLPGLALAFTLIFQTWGLKYTTATKSSFITTLYVVIVPFISAYFLKQKLPLKHWLWVSIALLGTVLIVELKNFNLNIGDSLTLVNSFAAAVHIILIDSRSKLSSNTLLLNATQSFWVALFAFPLMLVENQWSLLHLNSKAWIGLLSLTFGSSLIAFTLQAKAQKTLSPSIASLMFLLESPISWGFAILLLGESLNIPQAIGALLILIACSGVALGYKKTY